MQILIIIGIILAGMLLSIAVVSTIENRKLSVSHYCISSEKLPEEFDGSRILILADLHNAEFGENNERLIAKINEEKPDYILLAGDMLVGHPGQPTEIAAALICSLAERYPVYYGLGNHEERVKQDTEQYGSMWKDYLHKLKGTIVLLENARTELRKGQAVIPVYGLELGLDYYQRFHRKPLSTEIMDQMIGEPDKRQFNIMIAHTPEYFKEYAAWGADLIVSGHLHGGMVRFPGLGGAISPRVRIFPKYDRGCYEEGNSTMLLSGGLGNHTLKIRVNNIPEIMVVELKRKG